MSLRGSLRVADTHERCHLRYLVEPTDCLRYSYRRYRVSLDYWASSLVIVVRDDRSRSEQLKFSRLLVSFIFIFDCQTHSQVSGDHFVFPCNIC